MNAYKLKAKLETELTAEIEKLADAERQMRAAFARWDKRRARAKQLEDRLERIDRDIESCRVFEHHAAAEAERAAGRPGLFVLEE